MTAALNDFRSYLNRFTDIAKADRFRVIINPVSGLTSPQGLSFECEVSELPGRTIETFSARSYGPQYRYPHQSSYSDLNLTFLCMANMAGGTDTGIWEKAFFDDWMELINPSLQTTTAAPWNMGYRDDYSVSVIVNHYDIFDKRTYSVEFLNSYPIAITPMQLSWNDDSQLKLTIAFAYTSWIRKTAVAPAAADSGVISTTDLASSFIQGVENQLTLALNPNIKTGQTLS